MPPSTTTAAVRQLPAKSRPVPRRALADGQPPPSDLEAQCEVIARIIFRPDDAFARLEAAGVELVPEDYFGDVHHRIIGAVGAIRARGEDVDAMGIGAECGGAPVVTHEIRRIAEETPQRIEIEKRARRVIDVARLRRVIDAGYDIVANGYDANPATYPARALERLAEAAGDQAQPVVRAIPSPGAAIRGLASEGSVRRLETGFATLDEITRGGLMFGKFHVVGGPPNVGKTSVVAQIGFRAARAGVPTMVVAADVDDREAICIRFGQASGLLLADLEARNPYAFDRLAGLLDEVPLGIVDLDEDEACVEDAIDRLVAMPSPVGDVGRVLVVDSLQTVRTRLGAEAENEIDRVRATVKVLRGACKRYGLLVVASSELSRGAYRSKRKEDNCTSISAFKHSGDIEHAVTTALVLWPVQNEERPGLVDVDVPKNKRGRGDRPFRLEHDHARCRFDEVDRPDDGDDPSEDVKVEKGKERVRRALRRKGSFVSRTKLSEGAGGNKQANLQAVREMVDEGEIALVGGLLRLAPEAPR
jgi:replicative DNA helicase